MHYHHNTKELECLVGSLKQASHESVGEIKMQWHFPLVDFIIQYPQWKQVLSILITNIDHSHNQRCEK